MTQYIIKYMLIGIFPLTFYPKDIFVCFIVLILPIITQTVVCKNRCIICKCCLVKLLVYKKTKTTKHMALYVKCHGCTLSNSWENYLHNCTINQSFNE